MTEDQRTKEEVAVFVLLPIVVWLLIADVAIALVAGCGSAPKGETASTTKIEAGPGSPVSVENKPVAAPVTGGMGAPAIAPTIESPTGPVTVPVNAPQYGLDPARAALDRTRLRLWAGGLGAAATVVGGFLLIGAGALLKQAKFTLAGLGVVALGLAGGLATWFFA